MYMHNCLHVSVYTFLYPVPQFAQAGVVSIAWLPANATSVSGVVNIYSFADLVIPSLSLAYSARLQNSCIELSSHM